MQILKCFQPKYGKFYSKTLPLTYQKFNTKDVIINSRKKGYTTIFDVSQMNYIELPKNNSISKKLEFLFPIDLKKIPINKSQLNVLLDYKCNVLDDFIITNMDNKYRFIINSESIPLFNDYFDNIKYNIIPKKIIAIQGDGTKQLLENINLPIPTKFMHNINYKNLEITRCGYTGMDGVEIYGFENDLEYYLSKIIHKPNVSVGGLIERDILRIEANYCLSGNEFGIDKHIHFNEIDMDFIISKRRRNELNFIGANNLNNKPKLRRIYFTCNKSLLNTKVIYDSYDNQIGFITSSTFTYNQNKFIGIGYIQKDFDLCKKIFVKKYDKFIEIKI